MPREKRLEEEACSEALRRHLFSLGETTPELVFEPADPPDYWLNLGGERYAVEVAQITQEAQNALWDRLGRFANDLRAHCRGEAAPRGKYMVEADSCPELPGPGSRKWEKLLAAAVQAVGSLAATPAGTSRPLLEGAQGELTVTKLSAAGSVIGHVTCPGAFFFHAPPELAATVERKVAILERAAVPARCRGVILALHDRFFLADPEHIGAALAQMALPPWLHAVFWNADPFGSAPGGSFVFSRNPRWC